MFTKAFARDLAERVVATFCQALAALLIAAGTGILETGWVTALSVAGMTALVSLLKGIAAVRLGDSATGASLLADPPPRVERGASDWLVLIAVVVVALIVLGFAGVI